jgi:type II secretory pathway component PulK
MICREKGRAGSITLIALICLIVSTSVLVASVRRSVHIRREVDRLTRLRQCDWLLDAGIHRALDKLKRVNRYEGEQWNLRQPPPPLAHASVNIDVTRGSPVIVDVTAMVGMTSSDDQTSVIRRSFSFEFRNSSTEANPLSDEPESSDE